MTICFYDSITVCGATLVIIIGFNLHNLHNRRGQQTLFFQILTFGNLLKNEVSITLNIVFLPLVTVNAVKNIYLVVKLTLCL